MRSAAHHIHDMTTAFWFVLPPVSSVGALGRRAAAPLGRRASEPLQEARQDQTEVLSERSPITPATHSWPVICTCLSEREVNTQLPGRGRRAAAWGQLCFFKYRHYKSVIKAGWWDLLQSRSHRVGGDTRWAPAALPLSPSEVWICSSRCSWQSEQAVSLCGCCSDAILKFRPSSSFQSFGTRCEDGGVPHGTFSVPLLFFSPTLQVRKGQDICLPHSVPRTSERWCWSWAAASTPSQQTSQSVCAGSLFQHSYSSAAFQYRSVTAPFLLIHHLPVPFSFFLLILFSFAATRRHFVLFPQCFLLSPVLDQSPAQLFSFSLCFLPHISWQMYPVLLIWRTCMASTEAVLVICSCFGSWL